jgi:hypothetical protein
MALIQLGTADGATIGNPTGTDYWFFNDSNNPDPTGEAQFTRRDSSGIDTVYGTSSVATSFNIDLDSAEASVTRVVAGGRTTFTIVHSLNTLDLKPEVFRLSNGRTMGWRIERRDANTVEASRTGTVSDSLFRILIS